jgi:hypothetical protein
MLEEVSREIRIRIIDFIMSASMTSPGVIKEENRRFCNCEQRIYATSIT